TVFFGVPARGQTAVYVLDSSCSMGDRGAFAAARRELLTSLSRLPAMARLQVFCFSSSAEPLLGRRDETLPATPEDVNRAKAAPIKRWTWAAEAKYACPDSGPAVKSRLTTPAAAAPPGRLGNGVTVAQQTLDLLV